MSEQLAEIFAQCGHSQHWQADAYHLSREDVTGHKPNTTSGDFYLVGDDNSAGWKVIIHTHADKRPVPQPEGFDLIEIVAEFDNDADTWAWLRLPASQAFYLLDDDAGLATATGADRAAAAPTPLSHPDFQVPMTKHPYSHSKPLRLNRDDGESYDFQHLQLGFGRILGCHVHGSDMARNSPGYPMLHIAEANALADEILHRWNTHDGRIQQLIRAREVLSAAVVASGHKIEGTSDPLVAPDGEPSWVCEARGLIASIGGSVL